MQELHDRILKDGYVEKGDILKVDKFLNHQIDTHLFCKMADHWINNCDLSKVNKILTIEVSGIAIAFKLAEKLNVPLVFAKKTESINLPEEVYSTTITSYTKGRDYNVIVAKKYLNPGDNIFIVDDFLANGCALTGLISLIEQAGGSVAGIGIAIEKAFQPGGKEIRDAGYDVHSLARIKSIDYDTNKIEFCE